MYTGYFSKFTPSLMAPNDLEHVFVQRHDLAQELLELISESARTDAKHHVLLTGPRGIGKTHLTTLIHNRLIQSEDLTSRVAVAWLREEEWSVTSFLDLLICIIRALRAEYEDASLAERAELLYTLSAREAESSASTILREYLNGRTLILLAENLDDIFSGLGEEGQRRLRAFLQETRLCAITATAQGLFNGVTLRSSPFYGFFRFRELSELTFEEGIELLSRLAELRNDSQLSAFLRTPNGRARIRALRHLTGGNHRIYVVFSEFIDRESLDELVQPFMRMLDNLTPYYQARMNWLSPQQRKIVELLCERTAALPVKEIALRCFMTHQTASSQLRELREKGYVRSTAVGREVFYELQEPLIRLCVEVKNSRGRPISLFVDFLRLWYSPAELKSRLSVLDDVQCLERTYLVQALDIADSADLRISACWRDFVAYANRKDYAQAILATEELVAIRGDARDWILHGKTLTDAGRADEAVVVLTRACQLPSATPATWILLGATHFEGKEWDRCAKALEHGIQLGRQNHAAQRMLGLALCQLGRFQDALPLLRSAVAVDDSDVDCWFQIAYVEDELGNYSNAIECWNRVLELDSNHVSAAYNLGVSLRSQGRKQDAAVSFLTAFQLDPTQLRGIERAISLLFELEDDAGALSALQLLTSYHRDHLQGLEAIVGLLGRMGRVSEALEASDSLLRRFPRSVSTWINRAAALRQLGRLPDALSSLDQALSIDSINADALIRRAELLFTLQRHHEALETITRAIDLTPESPEAWLTRAEILEGLGSAAEAKQALDTAAHLGADPIVVIGTRGLAHLMRREFNEALAAFDEVINLDPMRTNAWLHRGHTLDQMDRLSEAVDSLRRAATLAPTDGRIWLQLGAVLMQQGDEASAESALDNAIKYSPTFAPAWLWLGKLHRKHSRFELAIECLNRALELDSDLNQVWLELAWCYSELGSPEEALNASDRAIQVRSSDPSIWVQRALLLIELERTNEALSCAQEAARLDSSYAQAWAVSGFCLCLLARWREASADFTEATRIEPDNARCWFGRGLADRNRGELVEAMQALEHATTLEPTEDTYWALFGEVLAEVGLHNQAVDAFSKAMDEGRVTAERLCNRSWSLLQLWRAAEALADTDQAISLAASIGPAHANRGLALLQMGQWAEGIQMLKSVLSASNDDSSGADPGDTVIALEVFFRGFSASTDVARWLCDMYAIYKQYGALPVLGQALLRHAGMLLESRVAPLSVNSWMQVWTAMGEHDEPMDVPLRLANVLVQFSNTEDRRLLLALPAEERAIIERLVETYIEAPVNRDKSAVGHLSLG